MIVLSPLLLVMSGRSNMGPRSLFCAKNSCARDLQGRSADGPVPRLPTTTS